MRTTKEARRDPSKGEDHATQDADYQAREAEQIRQSLARVNARIKVRELAERVKARESAHRR